MSRSKDAWAEQIEIARRIESERAEAAYFAVPEALYKNLEISLAHREESLNSYQAMRQENTELKRLLVDAMSWQSKWRERAVGFALGCAASVLASVVWRQVGTHWPLFR
jgi:hypothetical protein